MKEKNINRRDKSFFDTVKPNKNSWGSQTKMQIISFINYNVSNLYQKCNHIIYLVLDKNSIKNSFMYLMNNLNFKIKQLTQNRS